MKSISLTLMWHIYLIVFGFSHISSLILQRKGSSQSLLHKQINCNYFLRTMGVCGRSCIQTAYKTCFIFGSWTKPIILPITPQTNLYTISHRQAPESHSHTFAAQSWLSSRWEVTSSTPDRLHWKPWAPGTYVQLNIKHGKTLTDVCSARTLWATLGGEASPGPPVLWRLTLVCPQGGGSACLLGTSPSFNWKCKESCFLGCHSLFPSRDPPWLLVLQKVFSLDGSRAWGGGGEAYVWLDGKVTNVILNDLMGNAETWGSKEAAL